MKRLAVILKPRLSEKVYGLSQTQNTYVFDVSRDANKHDIAEAVKNQYEVGIKSVRVASSRGKSQRSLRRGGRSVRHFQRANIRKAYVTLKDGDKLPIFAAVEEPATKKPVKESK
ncbi:50S ribosomal protein L23 [Candidatus Saccharibacteria bacterium]|nr:50S ribosomal protein L23 [Candidatus Saccharibacteria bacterium]